MEKDACAVIGDTEVVVNALNPVSTTSGSGPVFNVNW